MFSSSPLRLILLCGLLSLPAAAEQPTSSSPDAAEQAELQAAAEEAIERFPLADVLDPLQADRLFRDARVGIQVVNTRSGEEVYAYGADEAFIPASVMKVVTAAVALKTLGPSWQFTTAMLTGEDAEIDEDGVLKADLHVWGGGDPTFVVEDMWRMARDLRLAGVNTVEGDLIFDGEYFDQDTLIAGWRKKDDLVNGPAYFSPVSALSVNYNTTCIVVAPGYEAGQPARVLLETPTELVEIESEVQTGRPGSRPWMTIEREVDWDKGTVKFIMAGNIPADEAAPWRYYRTMPDPALHYADVFRKMLEQQGVRIRGRNLLGKAPEDDMRLLVSHKSAPLQHLLTLMNKNSSNIIAESVLKAVGAETGGTPGTTDKGLAAVEGYLSGDLGIPREEYVLVNGSGLARGLQMRPSHVTAVLLDMNADEFVSAEFRASLAVGGQDGTLRRRFSDEAHVGRVRGKTGSVNGVYCLAGFIDGGDGEEYAFAFFVNDFKRSSRPVRRLQDRFGVALLDLPPPEEAQ